MPDTSESSVTTPVFIVELYLDSGVLIYATRDVEILSLGVGFGGEGIFGFGEGAFD